VEKPRVRLDLISRIGKTSGVPVVYVNTVGGNDSLIFDGQSMTTSSEGKLVFLGKPFEEELAVVDTSTGGPRISLPADPNAQIEKALVLGIGDYVRKCGFSRVHLGLSGGIDSALVATLAVEALGAGKVDIFSLPSRYSSEGSLTDARALADALGLGVKVLSIEEAFGAFLRTLEPVFEGKAPDIAEENIQARIRGTLLMAYSNKFNSLLLTTGNKSELATGYCTLYGDMSGGLAVIGDLLKVQVYALARAINARGTLIPESILKKAPSAELRPGQTDQDSLPPYDVLDGILEPYLVRNQSAEEISARGYDPALVKSVIGMVEKAEYKRRQAPPVLKVSPKAFGTGRRIPIARKFY
jgi:NAD+ synthase (glutamine-hydrolysing)